MTQITLFEQATLPKISGVTFSEAFDRERLTGQMKRVYEIMLKGEWLTLNEISRKSCFRNPNRRCEKCGNTGSVEIFGNDIAEGIGGSFRQPCEYCSKFDPEQLAEIEAYEATL